MQLVPPKIQMNCWHEPITYRSKGSTNTVEKVVVRDTSALLIAKRELLQDVLVQDTKVAPLECMNSSQLYSTSLQLLASRCSEQLLQQPETLNEHVSCLQWPQVHKRVQLSSSHLNLFAQCEACFVSCEICNHACMHASLQAAHSRRSPRDSIMFLRKRVCHHRKPTWFRQMEVVTTPQEAPHEYVLSNPMPFVWDPFTLISNYLQRASQAFYQLPWSPNRQLW